MNENDKRKYCTLWQEARDEALKRGFEMSSVCPMEEICSKEKCVFIEPLKKVEGIIYKVEPVISC